MGFPLTEMTASDAKVNINAVVSDTLFALVCAYTAEANQNAAGKRGTPASAHAVAKFLRIIATKRAERCAELLSSESLPNISARIRFVSGAFDDTMSYFAALFESASKDVGVPYK